MPGSADRIHVDVRAEPSKSEELARILAAIDVGTDSGSTVEIVLVTPGSPPTDDPLVVMGPDDEQAMLDAVDEGAIGYIVVDATPEDIQAALSTVAGGVAVIPPMMLGSLLRHTVRRRRSAADLEERLTVLTDREREVVGQLSQGKQRRDIARQLFISPETVRTHIQRAMAKLGVHSQNELMALLAPLDEGRP